MGTPHKIRRRALAAVVAAAALVAACSDDGDEAASTATGGEETEAAAEATANLPDTITIGYQNIPNGDVIVKQEGYLEEAFGPDVEIEWRLFDGGGAVNEAILAGAVDIGLVGSSPTSRGLSNGIEYQVPWIHDVIGDAEALAVREDITSIADLRGKTVATVFASTAHFSLLAALEDAGLSSDDVNIINAAPDEAYAAWTRGDVDGVYVWNPNLARILDEGGHTLITSADLAEQGKTTYDLAVVTNRFAEEFPEAVQIWIDQQDRAVRLIQEDPEAAAEIIAVELNITPEEALDQLGDLVFVRAADQAGPDYLGGTLATNLFAAAQFNQSLGEIESVADEATYQSAVITTFANGVAGG